jgi:hypothetical protein
MARAGTERDARDCRRGRREGMGMRCGWGEEEEEEEAWEESEVAVGEARGERRHERNSS